MSKPQSPSIILSDEHAMQLALAEAEKALEHGDVPIGALAIHDGKVIASRHNERELQQNPLAHAELLVLHDAASSLQQWRLNEITIVVTLEPCIMCAGALVQSRVQRVVFGTYDEKAGGCGSLYNMADDPRLNHSYELTSGVCADACAHQLTSFFSSLRTDHQI